VRLALLQLHVEPFDLGLERCDLGVERACAFGNQVRIFFLEQRHGKGGLNG
jgi:hypothetical protein